MFNERSWGVSSIGYSEAETGRKEGRTGEPRGCLGTGSPAPEQEDCRGPRRGRVCRR